MKIKDLIKELKKLDQNLEVFTSDFDHSEHEVHGPVVSVQLIDKDWMEENEEEPVNSQGNWGELPRKYVTIRH